MAPKLTETRRIGEHEAVCWVPSFKLIKVPKTQGEG